jgi:hypothetical protein
MKNRLAICSTYLQEIESKLSMFLASPDSDRDEKTGLTEALTFIHQAREAISEAQVKVDALHRRRNTAKDGEKLRR